MAGLGQSLYLFPLTSCSYSQSQPFKHIQYKSKYIEVVSSKWGSHAARTLGLIQRQIIHIFSSLLDPHVSGLIIAESLCSVFNTSVIRLKYWTRSWRLWLCVDWDCSSAKCVYMAIFSLIPPYFISLQYFAFIHLICWLQHISITTISLTMTYFIVSHPPLLCYICD